MDTIRKVIYVRLPAYPWLTTDGWMLVKDTGISIEFGHLLKSVDKAMKSDTPVVEHIVEGPRFIACPAPGCDHTWALDTKQVVIDEHMAWHLRGQRELDKLGKE